MHWISRFLGVELNGSNPYRMFQLQNQLYFLWLSKILELIVEEIYAFAGRDSSVVIAARYGMDGPGIECRCGRDFPHPSRRDLGPTESPVQWIPGHFIERPGRVNYPLPSSADVKKSRSIPLLPFLALMGFSRVKFTLFLFMCSAWSSWESKRFIFSRNLEELL